ncbi:hypothetical protein F4823DRAFT_608942, partial [Ustulina deusta]
MYALFWIYSFVWRLCQGLFLSLLTSPHLRLSVGVSGSWLLFLGVASLGLGEFGLRRFEDCVSLVSYLDRKVGKRHAG